MFSKENYDKLCDRFGYSDQNVSDISGILNNTLRAYIDNRTDIPGRAVNALCNIFGCSADVFLGRKLLTDEDADAIMDARTRTAKEGIDDTFHGTSIKDIADVSPYRSVTMPHGMDYIVHSRVIMWPYNLLSVICTKARKIPDNADSMYKDYMSDMELQVPITDDQYDGLCDAISALNEQEQTVIRIVYKENRPSKDAAEFFHVTRSRIQQIHSHAIRKLVHPALYKQIKYGRNGLKEIQKRNAYAEQIRILHEEIKLLTTEVNDLQQKDPNVRYVSHPQAAITMQLLGMQATRIADINFSTRTYNVLIRRGIRTLNDFFVYVHEHGRDWDKMRGFGRVSYAEIAEFFESCMHAEFNDVLYAIRNDIRFAADRKEESVS